MKILRKKHIFIILITILSTFNNQFVFSQCYISDSTFKYYKISYIITPKADSLYHAGEYHKSIEYQLTELDSTDYAVPKYILAQNYALLEMEDSAFFYLNSYVNSPPRDFRSVYVDEDFEILRKNKKEWNKIIAKIEDTYLQELDSSMNKEFAVKLFRLEIEDQKFGNYTHVSCRRRMPPSIQERVNRSIKVRKNYKKLVKKYGFPTLSKVGHTATISAFYILQHSIIADKYYYMAKEAYEKGDYLPELYALLTDRWLQQNGKTQIYGTQFSVVKNPESNISEVVLDQVEDFKNLNLRRVELGLPSVEEYAKKMNGRIPEEYYNE